MTGQPSGPPEWPLRGGMLKQPNKLVDAIAILRAELSYVKSPTKTEEPKRAEA